MSSSISLHFTGLVVFGARMISIFTGMIFLVMVTGWLPPARFGLWEILTDFVAFASYPATLLGFWAARDIARGNLQGRTILILNALLSSGGIAAYLVFTFLSYGSFVSNYMPFLLACLLVPSGYLLQATNSIAVGHRPAALGYALLVSEAGKLLVAYGALYVFHLEILGVILAVLASYLLQSVVLIALAWDVFSDPLSMDAGSRWLHYSWVPALNSLPAIVAIADTLVSALASPLSTQLTGYYQAAFSIGSLVAYVQFLTTAMYPLLLRGTSDETPNTTLDLLLMFAVPMVVGVTALSPRLLALLSPAYLAPGSSVSVAMALIAGASLAGALSGFLDSVLVGKEKVDIQDTIGIASYSRSSFWFVFKTNISYSLAYIPAVFAVTALGYREGIDVGSIVAVWASVQLLLYLPLIAYKLGRVRKGTRLVLPAGLFAYVLAAVLMAALLEFVSYSYLGYSSGRFSYGLKLTLTVALGGATYFGVLAILDKKVRLLESKLIALALGRGGKSGP